MKSIKEKFLNEYFLLEFSEHEIDEEMQSYIANTEKENTLYNELFNKYVTPILIKYQVKGYEIDNIIFRSFVKVDDKLVMLFDGLDKDEIVA